MKKLEESSIDAKRQFSEIENDGNSLENKAVEKRFTGLKTDIEKLKERFAKRVQDLKESAKKCEERQAKVKSLEASLDVIQRKVSKMSILDLPSSESKDVWTNLQLHNKQLQEVRYGFTKFILFSRYFKNLMREYKRKWKSRFLQLLSISRNLYILI